MKKKILSGNLIIFLLLSLSSCDDEAFLTEDPKTNFTINNVFTTPAQVEQTVIALYAHHRGLLISTDQAASWLWKSNGTDLIDHSTPNGSLTNYSTFTPEAVPIKDLFTSWYKLINKANLVIKAANMPQVAWSSEVDKTYAIAQARFFRAYSYTNLAELWGGVFMVTEVYDVPRYDFERQTRTAIYQYAIDELLAIENDLPVTTNAGGKIVRGAAQHVLCELYLALGIQLEADGKTSEAQTAYDNSISYGNKVINGGTYSLMTSRFGTRINESSVTIDIYKNGTFKASELVDTLLFTPNLYWDLWQEGNINYQDGNKECIWAIQCDYDAYKKEDGQARLSYPRMYGPAFRNWASMTNGTLEDLGGRGVIQQVPSFLWREIIWEGKWGGDLRNSEIVLRRRFKGNVPGAWYLKVIPWDVFYNYSKPLEEQVFYWAFCFPVSCKYASDKYKGIEEGENRSNIFRDDYAIRLPETILLRAEAKQRKGNKAGAADDVNLLRTRAKCSYLVTAADMDDNFNLILDERARELMYEEHRWNTLLRMGGTVYIDRIKKYMLWPMNIPTLTRTFNLLPIPQSVIDANNGVEIVQNPGWE